MTANIPGESQETQRRGRVPADTFGNRLLLARRMNGLTIAKAAALIQLDDEPDPASSWSNWENGRRPHDAPETIRLIATALDVDLQWLMFGGPLSPDARPRGRRAPKRAGAGTEEYRSVTVRPTDTRPPGRPPLGQRPTRNVGPTALTRPGAGQPRRPRLLKHLVSA